MKKIVYLLVKAVYPPYQLFTQLLYLLLSPPLYRMKSIKTLNEFTQRDSDIYVASYPKSGTTWMQMLMFQLTTDGELDRIPHLFRFSPFLEEVDASTIDALPSPRIIKTHHRAASVAGHKGKFIYVMRDGLDVMASYYAHSREIDNDRRSFKKFCRDFMRGNVRCGSWFRHVQEWLKFENDSRFLFVKYEDMTRNLEQVVRDVVRLCELDVTEDVITRTVKNCSIEYMRSRSDKIEFQPYLVLNLQDRVRGKLIRDGKVGAGSRQEENLGIYRKQFDKYLSGSSLSCYSHAETGNIQESLH